MTPKKVRMNRIPQKYFSPGGRFKLQRFVGSILRASPKVDLTTERQMWSGKNFRQNVPSKVNDNPGDP